MRNRETKKYRKNFTKMLKDVAFRKWLKENVMPSTVPYCYKYKPHGGYTYFLEQLWQMCKGTKFNIRY